jgi:hypothetical protein
MPPKSKRNLAEIPWAVRAQPSALPLIPVDREKSQINDAILSYLASLP